MGLCSQGRSLDIHAWFTPIRRQETGLVWERNIRRAAGSSLSESSGGFWWMWAMKCFWRHKQKHIPGKVRQHSAENIWFVYCKQAPWQQATLMTFIFNSHHWYFGHFFSIKTALHMSFPAGWFTLREFEHHWPTVIKFLQNMEGFTFWS